MAGGDELSAERYEPSVIDLTNRNSAHTLIVELAGFGKTVLEVGTATGYLSKVLKERGNRIVGIELDANAASRAAQHCEQMIVADVELLDFATTFASQLFDVIIFGDILEHLKWPQRVLQQARPLLKPDGYLVVSIPNVTHGDVILHLLRGRFPYHDKGLLDLTHLRFFGPEDVSRLLSGAGFELADVHTTHLPIGATELHLDLRDFPLELVGALRRHPHAETYQFVFRAFPEGSGRDLSTTRHSSALHGASFQAPPEYDELQQARHSCALLQQELQYTKEIVAAIQGSRGWKALQVYYRVRNRLLRLRGEKRAGGSTPGRAKRLGRVLSTLRRVKPSQLTKFVRYCRAYGVGNTIKLTFRKLKEGETAPRIDIRPLLVPRFVPTLLEDGLPLIDRKVSVVLPTKNAGREFRLLLQKLKSQKGIKECEIIVVDSGSSDNTIEDALSEGVQLVEIPSDKFSHSYSRNIGADHARGDYLLFMVQDALPLTDRWLWEMCRALESNDVAAVSCAEYPRADADLFYRLLIWNHYRTLKLDQDRILKWDESCFSHIGLRSNAQINNVAGLVRADIFRKYRFQRDYAEDLDLGIRLIKDGHKLGFLYSTRVVHSHNRPPLYFLKRAYVDSRFLVDVFADFAYPAITDEPSLHADITALYSRVNYVAAWVRSSPPGVTPEALFGRIHILFSLPDGSASPEVPIAEDEQLSAFLHERLGNNGKSLKFDPARNMVLQHLLFHLQILNEFVSGIYSQLDQRQIRDVAVAITKIFALHAGAHLAYLFLTCRDKQPQEGTWTALDPVLRSGV